MREIKFRYFWWKKWYYIDFDKDNLKEAFAPYERRTKTTHLCEFTGLLDAQGKEIYEGDILMIVTSLGRKPILKEVIFEKGTWNVQSLLVFGNMESKVIGNIYENPELLK